MGTVWAFHLSQTWSWTLGQQPHFIWAHNTVPSCRVVDTGPEGYLVPSSQDSDFQFSAVVLALDLHALWLYLQCVLELAVLISQVYFAVLNHLLRLNLLLCAAIYNLQMSSRLYLNESTSEFFSVLQIYLSIPLPTLQEVFVTPPTMYLLCCIGDYESFDFSYKLWIQHVQNKLLTDFDRY